MSSQEAEFLVACELHDPVRLRAVLEGGFAADARLGGRSALEALLETYTRSERLPDCVRLLLARGARFAEPALEHVLLDDAEGLRASLGADSVRRLRVDLPSAFTPLRGASLLHVAAEYGHAAAARALLELGADPDARAGLDAHGLGGQTPLFHVVNSHANRSLPVLRLLLAAGARVDLRVDGLTWGEGQDWETTLFDLSPLSYAQFGLLPQMHRDERGIDEVVRLLLAAGGRSVPPLRNVPNRYLRPRA